MTEPTTTADTTFEALRDLLGIEDAITKSYVQSLLWVLEGVPSRTDWKQYSCRLPDGPGYQSGQPEV